MPLNNASALNDVQTSNITINSVSIPFLLEWWQQRKRLTSNQNNLHAPLPKGDEAYLQAYYRLMEVYSVVKSGGVKAQMEAVQAFTHRELGLLNQQLTDLEQASDLANHERDQRRQRVEQEIKELDSAHHWRIQALTDINPEEEALVKRFLPDIEKILIQAQCV